MHTPLIDPPEEGLMRFVWLRVHDDILQPLHAKRFFVLAEQGDPTDIEVGIDLTRRTLNRIATGR